MPNPTMEGKVVVRPLDSRDVKFCYLAARNVVLLIFFSSPYFCLLQVLIMSSIMTCLPNWVN